MTTIKHAFNTMTAVGKFRLKIMTPNQRVIGLPQGEKQRAAIVRWAKGQSWGKSILNFDDIIWMLKGEGYEQVSISYPGYDIFISPLWFANNRAAWLEFKMEEEKRSSMYFRSDRNEVHVPSADEPYMAPLFLIELASYGLLCSSYEKMEQLLRDLGYTKTFVQGQPWPIWAKIK